MDKQELVQLIGRKAVEVIPALGGHAFVPSDSLQALGANSIDRAEILFLVLEEIGLDIPRVQLFGPTNIGELAERIVEMLQSA